MRFKQNKKGDFGHITEPHSEIIATNVKGMMKISIIDGCGCGCGNFKKVFEIAASTKMIKGEDGIFDNPFPHNGHRTYWLHVFKQAIEKHAGRKISQFHLTSTRKSFRGICR